MEDQYRKIIETVPFNSFTSVIHAVGGEVPESLGGSCVFQARNLVSSLREAGYDARYIEEEEGHVAVLCELDGKSYYMDPYLLHLEPICLSDAFSRGREVCVEAAPVIDGHRSKVIVSSVRADVFNVSLLGWIRKHQDSSSVWGRNFNLKNVSEELGPRPFVQQTRPIRKSIKKFDKGDLSVRELRMAFSARATSLTNADLGKIGSPRVQSVFYPGNFVKEFSELAHDLGLEAERLREIILFSERVMFGLAS